MKLIMVFLLLNSGVILASQVAEGCPDLAGVYHCSNEIPGNQQFSATLITQGKTDDGRYYYEKDGLKVLVNVSDHTTEDQGHGPVHYSSRCMDDGQSFRFTVTDGKQTMVQELNKLSDEAMRVKIKHTADITKLCRKVEKTPDK